MTMRDSMTLLTRHAYQLMLRPKSQKRDDQRRELILNILLLGLTIVSLAAVIASATEHFLIDTDSAVDSFVLTTGFCGLIITLWYLSRRGLHQIGSYALIILVWLAATMLSYRWSIELPQAEVTYTLAIVMAGVLLSSRAGLAVVAITTAVIVSLDYGQSHHLLHPNLHWIRHLSQAGDVVGFVVVFIVIGLVSWLSNREIDRSLKRARASEAALTAERDNLEIAVHERTLKLEQAQAERVMELQRFAEFGRLTGGLLHDLVNPLTSASLSLELIGKKQRSHLVEQAQDNLQHLERYVQAARKQLQKESQIRAFTVETELGQAVSILVRRANLAKVTIELPSTKIDLVGDPVKFNQLITNLIANAIDAYVEAARPSPKRLIQVDTVPIKGGVRLTVTDWGGGIPAAILPKIFTPFYSTKHGRGTGIGLAMVKEIAEEDFGGAIIATSTPRGRTRFVVDLRDAPMPE
jgi:signal transduction histidine kinase